MKKILPFNKLPKWKQRVEIAKDVILQLNLKKYVPECRTYINITPKTDENYYDIEMNKLVEENKVTCNVCAKGALFMSHVMKTDNCTYDEAKGVGSGRIRIRLTMFSDIQLDKIECAFEGWEEDNSISKMGKFIRKYKNDKDRLIMIMKNIIRNKGTFKL